MKWILTGAVAAAVLGASISPPAFAADKKAPDGKPIFTQYKCASCHSIEAQGITKKKGEAAEPAEGAETARKPPDLSSVGKDHNAAWITAYLKKKEARDGKKHLKMFRGTDAELATLAAWLETLKADKPEPKDKAAK